MCEDQKRGKYQETLRVWCRKLAGFFQGARRRICLSEWNSRSHDNSERFFAYQRWRLRKRNHDLRRLTEDYAHSRRQGTPAARQEEEQVLREDCDDEIEMEKDKDAADIGEQRHRRRVDNISVRINLTMAVVAVVSFLGTTVFAFVAADKAQFEYDNLQPFIIVEGGPPESMRIRNAGKGVAKDVFVLRYDAQNKFFALTREEDVVLAIASEAGGAVSVHARDTDIFYDPNQIASKVPCLTAEILVGFGPKTWTAVMYSNIRGERFVNKFNGVGNSSYWSGTESSKIPAC